MIIKSNQVAALKLAPNWRHIGKALGGAQFSRWSQRHQVSLLHAIEKLYKISYKKRYVSYDARTLNVMLTYGFAINEMVNKRSSQKMPYQYLTEGRGEGGLWSYDVLTLFQPATPTEIARQVLAATPLKRLSHCLKLWGSAPLSNGSKSKWKYSASGPQAVADRRSARSDRLFHDSHRPANKNYLWIGAEVVVAVLFIMSGVSYLKQIFGGKR